MTEDENHQDEECYDFDGIMYIINNENMTASIVESRPLSGDITIPYSISTNNNEYVIVSILGNAFMNAVNLESIDFDPRTQIKRVELESFTDTIIESFTIPTTLVELEEGWCNGTSCLKKIEISPDNPRYKLYGKLIIGKSSQESDNYDELVFCCRDAQTVKIPNFIKKIDPFAFEKCNELHYVEFEQGSQIISIGTDSFSNTQIECISFPPTLIDVNKCWCCGTSTLIKIDVSPDNPMFKLNDDKLVFSKSSIEDENFDSLFFCPRNVETIKIPSFIKKINSFAFDRCINLKYIEVPEDSELEFIDEYAFYESSIEKITIPSKVIELKEGWCESTPNLTKIEVSPDNPFFSAYDDKLIIRKSSIEEENYDILSFCVRDIKDITIPSFIKKIEPDAFHKCNRIKNVKFTSDSELKIIDKYAFNCSSIISINIPCQLEIIGEYAFDNCSDLRYVEIPYNSNLQEIKKFAFNHTSIEKINIPIHLKVIEEYAFYGCRCLKNADIKVDSELQVIEKFAFENSVIESITIPIHMKRISQGTFNICRKLQYVKIPNDSELEVIEDVAFFMTSLENINIPPNLKIIEKEAFCFCDQLRDIVIPKNSELQIIRKRAFSETSIRSIYLPKHLKLIDEGAFYKCKKLKKVIIAEDSELQTINIEAFSKTLIENFIIPSNLVNISEGFCIDVPYVKTIEVSPLNIKYLFYNNLLIGKSSIEQDDYDELLFAPRIIGKIEIPSNIKRIGRYALENSIYLNEVNFSKNSELEIIDKFAFFSCSFLPTIEIPPTVTEIREDSFSYCFQLKECKIPADSKLTQIHNNAFNDCKLKSFYIPSHVTRIGEAAFLRCAFLLNVEFPDDSELQIISNLAFASSGIVEFTVPKHLKQICKKAFWNCTHLQKFNIPDDCELSRIEENALAKTKIDSFSIPKSLVQLDDGWCSETPKLTNIKISPENPNYKLIEDKIIIGRDDPESEQYDLLIFASRDIEDITIPNYIKKIGRNAFDQCNKLNEIKITTDSKLETIKNSAFCASTIENITIPSGFVKFENGWCFGTKNLTKINIFPSNQNFIYLENQLIIGKTDLKSNEYDTLVFARRDIKIARIPTFIKVIGQYAFNSCIRLQRIEIPIDSKLESIEPFAFCDSPIQTISIPNNVKNIGRNAFMLCTKLNHIYFTQNSQLKNIGKEAFLSTAIDSFVIPNSVIKIEEKAFFCMNGIKIIEIGQNAKLHSFDINIFGRSTSLIIITAPHNLNIILNL